MQYRRRVVGWWVVAAAMVMVIAAGSRSALDTLAPDGRKVMRPAQSQGYEPAPQDAEASSFTATDFWIAPPTGAGAPARLDVGFTVEDLFAVAQTLFGAQDPFMREQAVWALPDNDGLILHALLARAAADPDADVRAAARARLRGLPEQALPNTQQWLLPPELLALYDSANQAPATRIESAMQLLASVDENTLQVLHWMLATDPLPSVRGTVVDLLAQSGSPAALEVLSQGLADQSPVVRQRALRHLIAQPELPIPLLGQVLQSDADPAVRALAAETLAATDHPAAQALLILGVDDPDDQVRLYAQSVTFN